MANYPSPCDKCKDNNNGSCPHYRKCAKWLTRYRYRQAQINAYARKVLPGFYERQKVGANNG